MNALLACVLFLLAISCAQPAKQPPAGRLPATDSPVKVSLNPDSVGERTAHIPAVGVDSGLFITIDSVRITAPVVKVNEVYTRAEFNYVISHNPELYTYPPLQPDSAYRIWCKRKKEGTYNSCGSYVSFGSEAGQDGFNVLYGWFLRKHTGDGAHIVLRKQLIEAYEWMNSLHDHFVYGGTYFSHQTWRIVGYAEYDLYRLQQKKIALPPAIQFAAAKSRYLHYLRNLVKEQVKIDENLYTDKMRTKREKELLILVDQIGKYITDQGILTCVRQFQEDHYSFGI